MPEVETQRSGRNSMGHDFLIGLHLINQSKNVWGMWYATNNLSVFSLILKFLFLI
jgi:hypothetical protein